MSEDNYRACLARASRALTSGKFPTTTLHLIDEDIRTTLPSLHIFTPSSGPLYQDLKDMLCAWMVTRSDEGLGYVTGASKIAAMFLLNMHPPNAFVAMRNLLERHCLRSFYGGLAAKDDVGISFLYSISFAHQCVSPFFRLKRTIGEPCLQIYLLCTILTIELVYLILY